MKRMIHKFSRILLISCLILALGVAPAFAMEIPVWINNSSAPIYLSDGTCGTVRAGTACTVTALKNGWAQVTRGNYVAYVHTRYLTLMQGIPGYVCKRVCVYQYPTTASAAYGPLAVGTPLSVVGLDGDFYQVTNGKALGYIARSAMSRTKPSNETVLASMVEPLEWNTCDYFFPKGAYGVIYDILTGTSIRVYRLGGTNHAELEPYSAEDTQLLLNACGGQFSWDSRPVLLLAGNHVAPAAINTMPHGDQSITTNNYDGQFCLHLKGSTTHGTESVNVNHQQAILYAWMWAQSKL